ncbi:hypothetical protein PHM1_149 [Eurybiavirus PHM1]|uniref:Uncharacterized protein n=1 Tax=Prochlorococcus phage P-HM1 TaxID=445700 RepID=E3SMY0_9CAUD|nr:hypothetical protein PHM1_149 [Prochlorococcus phage P-HM1]ADO98773.1 hypothetical protein PHM1_149 [Prochlorococcus phage P-HM1]
MARKKKEPINVTPPTPPQFLVKSERVKVVVMFNGDNVICDLQEAVDKESGARQAYIMNYPYKVNYDSPKMDKTGIVTDPEVKVHYAPWCPLSPEVKIPINQNMVVTILEPVPSLRDTYITNVQKMGGSIE